MNICTLVSYCLMLFIPYIVIVIIYIYKQMHTDYIKLQFMCT